MCLFPLLQGLIGTSQGSEKELAVYRRRKGLCKRHGLLREHERLFINPCFQQSIDEAERTGDLCPDVLDLFGERERHAATANAIVHLSNIHLCQCQEPPA